MSEQQGLSRYAYEPTPEGTPYEPYVPASATPAEFTMRALVPGVLLGIVFGAANAYLGLRVGLTISTSIPVAVLTVATFRALRGFGGGGTLLEANLAQTTGSASSSVASGVIFTLPALFLWGLSPSLLQMTLLAICGGLLGVLFMIPLRRFLIDQEHGRLPYPEGTACAEVLVASEIGGGQAQNVFAGLFIGAVFKLLVSLAKVVKHGVSTVLPWPNKASMGLELSSALLGVGYILGPRIGAVMVGGGLLSSLVIIPWIAAWGAARTEPLAPETVELIAAMTPAEIWTRYVRYIGAGAVATAGFVTLIRSIPMMLASFSVGTRQLRERWSNTAAPVEQADRTRRDLPLHWVLYGAGVIALVLAVVPQAFGTIDDFFARAVAALLVAVFAFFFVTVSARIVGLVGVTSNPTSGMTIAALLGTALVFLLMGWTDLTGKAGALCVGCVVAIAASIAGDTSQDLKTGFLLGATPRRQQVAELIGVLTSSIFVCMTIQLLSEQPGGGFGSEELPAPQATLMKVVIDGVLDQQLPWGLVGIGVGLALAAEIVRIPALPFAVGVYLPVSTMVPVFLGGMLRWWLERRAADAREREARRERGVLFGSGLVGGEGLMGVAIAGVAIVLGRKTVDRTDWIADWLGRAWAPDLLAVIVFGALAWGFARLARGGRRKA